MSWTREEVYRLAPDTKAVKAAERTVAPALWIERGGDERALWGTCRGSGRATYAAAVDLAGPAYRCSCPSRKTPCKHILGLLLAWSDGRVAEDRRPDEVAAWLGQRDARGERAQRASVTGPAQPKDIEAAAARRAAREARVADGVDDLSRWLADLLRGGLAGTLGHGTEPWEATAARMVDAQASGLARRVRTMGALASGGGGGGDASPRLVDAVGTTALLLAAARRQDLLDEPARADVRQHLGWSVPQDEVLAGEHVEDAWTCVGETVTVDERVTTTRTWLHGAGGRWALVLTFAAGGAASAPPFTPGEVADSALAFYPGAAPLRALVDRRGAGAPAEPVPAAADLQGALGAVAERLAVDPLTTLVPVAVDDVRPAEGPDGWLVRDHDGRAVPLTAGFAAPLSLASVAAEGGIRLVGEWDGFALRPLGTWSDAGYTAW